MKAFLLLLIAPVISTQAATLKVKCEAPDLHYVYRFEMEQSFANAWQDEENNDAHNLYVSKLNLTATKAGHEAKAQDITLKGLRGKLTKVNSSFTPKPYYNLKLQSKDKQTFIQLNLDYPSKLSSFVKTADGFKYKATCKLEEFKGCIFGDSLHDTLDNEKVAKEELGDELKVIPGFNEDNNPVNTKKVKFTFSDKSQFIAWYTYQDEVDGGNTYGTIEDLSGKEVAEIGDGDIYKCTLTQNLK
jgi:hypothetical protein